MTMTDGNGTHQVLKVFIDTNILTRATIITAPLHQEAKTSLTTLWNQGAELWISRQVIREYVANATRPQTYSPAIPINLVEQQVQNFLRQFQVADDTDAVTRQLLLLLNQVPTGGKQVHDANIVASMLVYGINTLHTNNVQDFARFSNYITIQPL